MDRPGGCRYPRLAPSGHRLDRETVAALQEGRQRIAELALEGKHIPTGRRRAAPEISPEAQRIETMVRQLAELREQEKAALGSCYGI